MYDSDVTEWPTLAVAPIEAILRIENHLIAKLKICPPQFDHRSVFIDWIFVFKSLRGILYFYPLLFLIIAYDKGAKPLRKNINTGGQRAVSTLR